jgi:hypothetical protein
MPANHSSSVSLTSRAKACRCCTRTGHDLPQAFVGHPGVAGQDGLGDGVFVQVEHGLLAMRVGSSDFCVER